MIIDIKDVDFFTVTSYKGDINLDYLHLYSCDATLFHSGRLDPLINRFIMEEALRSHDLNKTIYRSDDTVLALSRETQDVGCESVSALSVAVKTTHVPSKNRKVNASEVSFYQGKRAVISIQLFKKIVL